MPEKRPPNISPRELLQLFRHRMIDNVTRRLGEKTDQTKPQQNEEKDRRKE